MGSKTQRGTPVSHKNPIKANKIPKNPTAIIKNQIKRI